MPTGGPSPTTTPGGGCSSSGSAATLRVAIAGSVRLIRTTASGTRDYLVVGYARCPLNAQRGVQGQPPVICVFEENGPLAWKCSAASDLASPRTLLAQYPSETRHAPPTTLTGIAPDGVGAVKATYPGGDESVVPVRNNLLIFTTPLPLGRALALRLTRLTSDGR